MEHNVVWSHLYQPGMEHLRLAQGEDEIHADGLVIAVVDEVPARVHYHIRCDLTWCVRELRVALLSEGGFLGDDSQRDNSRAGVNPAPTLHVYADGQGHWTTASGEALPDLDGCIDVDISVTPFTNTLPIRRLALASGASQEIVVAYIKVPDITLQPFGQRYTCLNIQAQGGTYRYDSVVSGFTADLSVDNEGLVIDYPGLFQRAWPSS
jgi:hypothetical protein